ncbi:MAG: hypothetical protein VX385_05690, partial [Acidobacteriota bacterium]|nr:hypothetical protein [Acidobacteriota bacterium]
DAISDGIDLLGVKKGGIFYFLIRGLRENYSYDFKNSKRARASPDTFFMVSEFGKWLFRNILEVVVSRILSFIFLIVGYRYNPFKGGAPGCFQI